MFSVIWSIAICIIVIRLVRSKKEQGPQNKSGNGNYPQQGTLPHQRFQGKPQQTQKPQQRPVSRQTLGAGQKPQDEPEAGSTLAYLEEKARQDAEEHAREKREEAQRLHKNFGGLRVAERLYEGNAVPNGKRCIVCGYCGAENLVPMMPRERYSCFFCREPIN